MKTIIWKAYWDYEKEEHWLNAMSARGLALRDYSWCRYVFEPCMPGEYIYRIELLEHSSRHPESRRYLEFMEESGVEIVTEYIRWVFFRKKAEDGPFDVYSDIESRLKHYRSVNAMWLALSLMEFIIGAAILSSAVLLARSIGTPPYNAIISGVLFVVSAQFLVLGRGLRKKIRALKKERMVRG